MARSSFGFSTRPDASQWFFERLSESLVRSCCRQFSGTCGIIYIPTLPTSARIHTEVPRLAGVPLHRLRAQDGTLKQRGQPGTQGPLNSGDAYRNVSSADRRGFGLSCHSTVIDGKGVFRRGRCDSRKNTAPWLRGSACIQALGTDSIAGGAARVIRLVEVT
jgi:hypothetical protein